MMIRLSGKRGDFRDSGFLLLCTALLCLFLLTNCGYENTETASKSVVGPSGYTVPGSDIGDMRVDLSWPAPGEDVTAVEIYRQDLTGSIAIPLTESEGSINSALGNEILIATLPPGSTSFSDTTVSCGRNYQYKVCNVKGNGERSCSPPINAATPLCPPKDLTADLVARGSVELNWTDNSADEDYFRIYRKTAPSGAYEYIGFVGADVTTYTDTAVECGAKYLYKVRAFNEKWGSGYSNEASATMDLCPGPGGCYVWFVDDNAPGRATGMNWHDAFNVLQQAMDAAGDCDEIWVAGGMYYRPIGGNEPVLTMKDGVSVYGGFAGTEMSLAERGDPADNPSILDGEASSLHVITGASDTVLDGLTVTGGNAIGTGLDLNGAGLLVLDANNMVVVNSTFSGNISGSGGGGIMNSNSSLDVFNCILENNTSATCGGGLYNFYSTANVTNTSFYMNESKYGGGALNQYSTVNISNCNFEENISNWNGGGLHNNFATTVVTDCYFYKNSAVECAGGSDTYTSEVTYNRCFFLQNYAGGMGGAISSGNDGSGTTSYSVINCVIVGNTGGIGGGIYCWMAAPKITNCTIVNNTATGSRGGGALFNDGPSYSVITNSILWDNHAPSYPEIRNQAGSVTVSYSDVKGGYSGTGNINVLPGFVSSYDDLHLLSNSPCINTGTATGAPAEDIEGNPRPYGAGYDMGAYEYR